MWVGVSVGGWFLLRLRINLANQLRICWKHIDYQKEDNHFQFHKTIISVILFLPYEISIALYLAVSKYIWSDECLNTQNCFTDIFSTVKLCENIDLRIPQISQTYHSRGSPYLHYLFQQLMRMLGIVLGLGEGLCWVEGYTLAGC